MFFDPLYFLIVGPAILLALLAQVWVKSAYGKWSRVIARSGLTGAQAARDMLAREGITNVRIEQVNGFLSDHYDPGERVLRLSPDVYSGRSVAALGIACHEAGHALQHANGYAFLGLRSVLVPTANIGSWLSFPLIFAGLIFNYAGLILVGIIAFSAVVLFQMITLPVEFNASSRAKDALTNNGVLGYPEEIEGVNAVLGAAAMTYVAATITALAHLLYYVMLFSRRN